MPSDRDLTDHEDRKNEAALARAKKFQIIVSVFLASGLLFILLALGLTLHEGQARKADTAQVRYAFCVELEKVRKYVRDSAQRGKKSLPDIEYYKQNPHELEAALNNLEIQRQSFSPALNCSVFADEGYTDNVPEDTGG